MSFGTFAILLGINAALAACLLLFNTRRGGALRMGAWLWLAEFATARTKAVGDELTGGGDSGGQTLDEFLTLDESGLIRVEAGQRLAFRDFSDVEVAMLVAQAALIEKGINPLDLRRTVLHQRPDGYRAEICYDAEEGEAWKGGAKA